MQSLQQLQDIYANPQHYARHWKERTGGKIVGCLGLDIPEEMVLASGMLPVQVQAAPQASLAAIAPYGEGSSGPVLSSLAARLLDGSYDYLDYLAIATRPHFYSEIYAFLRELKKAQPELVKPEITLVDLHHEERASTHEFNRQTFSLFRSQLEAWSNQRISDADLSQAIASVNHIRRLLNQVNSLRRQDQIKLSGSDALAIIESAFLMDKREYLILLEDYLAEAAQLPSISGMPVIYSGSNTHSLAIYQGIEAGGVVIIADDQNAGSRRIEVVVEEAGNPQEALLQRYWHRAPTSATSHTEQRADYLQSLHNSSAAQGVIFYILAADHPSAWDLPVLRDRLTASNITHLALSHQPFNQQATDELTSQVAQFVASLKL